VLHSLTKVALTSHRLSPISGEPGSLERVGVLEGEASAEELVVNTLERIEAQSGGPVEFMPACSFAALATIPPAGSGAPAHFPR
jgi:hypothetical protein